MAIRASIALPSIITPVMINGRLVADGGLMSPIEAAAEETVEEVFGALPPGLRVLDVMDMSIDAMQNLVTRYRLAAYRRTC